MPGISLGRFGEPLPDVRPAALARAELAGGADLTIDRRIEAVVRLALLYEGLPSRVIESEHDSPEGHRANAARFGRGRR